MQRPIEKLTPAQRQEFVSILEKCSQGRVIALANKVEFGNLSHVLKAIEDPEAAELLKTQEATFNAQFQLSREKSAELRSALQAGVEFIASMGMDDPELLFLLVHYYRVTRVYSYISEIGPEISPDQKLQLNDYLLKAGYSENEISSEDSHAVRGFNRSVRALLVGQEQLENLLSEDAATAIEMGAMFNVFQDYFGTEDVEQVGRKVNAFDTFARQTIIDRFLASRLSAQLLFLLTYASDENIMNSIPAIHILRAFGFNASEINQILLMRGYTDESNIGEPLP